MRLLHIRVDAETDADCLARELAAYAPSRSERSVRLQLDERSEADLLAVLAALETCLIANDIRSVRLELDGRKYLLSPQA
jgi:hypothetical protein